MIGLILALSLASPTPCSLPTVAATPPPTKDSVSVVLPKSLDPTGCPQLLPHGTRVFKIPTILVESTREANGGIESTFDVISGYGLKANVDGANTVYTDECGNSYSVPSNSKITRSWDDFAFFAPDQPLTEQFCKETPDFVVP